LETNTQVNHAIIAGAVSPFNRAVQGARSWSLGSIQSTTLLDHEITRQAQIIAYIDDFKIMLVIAVIVLPLILLTKPSPNAAKPTRPRSTT
jgi:MFS transporter, DHA2 family, multidrug resistance protein